MEKREIAASVLRPPRNDSSGRCHCEWSDSGVRQSRVVAFADVIARGTTL